MRKLLNYLFVLIVSISVSGCNKKTWSFDYQQHWFGSGEKSEHSFEETDNEYNYVILKCNECGYMKYKDENPPSGTDIFNLTYCYSSNYQKPNFAFHPKNNYETFLSEYREEMHDSELTNGFYFLKPNSYAYTKPDSSLFAPFLGDWTHIDNSGFYLNSLLNIYDSSISNSYISNKKDGWGDSFLLNNITLYLNIELFCSFREVKKKQGSVNIIFGNIDDCYYCDIYVKNTAIGSVRFFEHSTEKQPLLRSWLVEYISANLIYLEN